MSIEIRLSFFFSLLVLVKEFKMVSWCTLVCLLGVLTITAAGENRLLLVDKSVGHTNIGVAYVQTSPISLPHPLRRRLFSESNKGNRRSLHAGVIGDVGFHQRSVLFSEYAMLKWISTVA